MGVDDVTAEGFVNTNTAIVRSLSTNETQNHVLVETLIKEKYNLSY